MATEISAYNYRLWEIRFHQIDFNVPGYDDDPAPGRVSVETTLNFGMDENFVFCTLSLDLDLIKGKEGEVTDDSIAASLKLSGTGRFELPLEHGLCDDDFQDLDDSAVRSFSKIMEPLMVMKARSILADASIDASGVPLQLVAPE